MCCFYCPFWLPDNPHSVNGKCTHGDFPSRADTECPEKIDCEVASDETL